MQVIEKQTCTGISAFRLALARGVSSLPNVRGKGRLWQATNAILLRLGAPPVDVRPMCMGHLMILDLRVFAQCHAFCAGQYDDFWIELLAALLPDCSTFLDVGANVGLYSVAIAHKRRAGNVKVFAFEPELSNRRRLVENITLNNLSDAVQVFPFGLSSSESEVDIVLREDFLTGGTGNASIAINKEWDRRFPRQRVKMVRYDDCPSLPRNVDVIKVDIEGHELEFLSGAKGMLTRSRPIILSEVNKAYYRAKGVLPGLLLKNEAIPGYLAFRRVRGHDELLRVRAIEECAELDDVLLVPPERVNNPVLAALRRGRD